MNESLPFFGAEDRAEGYRKKAVEMYQTKAERLQRARTSIAEVLERSLKHVAGLDETAPFTEGAEVQIVSSLLPERGETGVIQSRHAVCGGTIYQVLRHDTTAAALQQHVERRESDLSGFYLPEQLRLVSDITKDETARETLEVATEMIEAAKDETKTELSLWRGWVLALYECKSRRDQMS